MSAAKALAPEAQHELVHALELHLPGLEIVDRELEIRHGDEAGRVAALVGRASGGLLVLIEALEGAPGPAALRALELCALVREHAQDLLRRFECSTGPRLVLLADEHAREIEVLLAPLLGPALQLFGVSELRSQAGARFGLVALSGARDAHALPTRADFLAGLEAPARALAEFLWERLESPALGARAEIGGAGVRWSDARGVLCNLAREPNGLSGGLAGLDEALALGTEADARAFLDAVLGVHLQRLGDDLEGPVQGTSTAAFNPREPVLSEAEIAAFHD